MRILVVDDEQGMVDLLVSYLKREGHAVDFAYNGNSAMAIIKQNPFDVLFVDYQMPGKSGLEVVDYTKKNSVSTKVVMISGIPQMEAAIAKIVGADEYMEKPLDFKKIDAILQKFSEVHPGQE